MRKLIAACLIAIALCHSALAQGRLPNPVFDPAFNAPLYMASKYGVVANLNADQSAVLNTAMAAMPASGAQLLLPCGDILVGHPLVLTGAHVTLSSADGAQCTHLISTFPAGDFLTISGQYSGATGIFFDVAPSPAQTAGNLTPFRTAGATVNLRGGDNFLIRNVMRGCFVCVGMATTGDTAVVRDNTMAYIADGTTNPGSGGIDVNNQGIGPENWIENNYILANYAAAQVYHPSFGIRLVNTGATHLHGNDVTGAKLSFAIVPGYGQKVEATFSTDNVWDNAYTSCVYIAPTGTGYVFHTTFNGDWCTTNIPYLNGVTIAGAASTGDQGRSGGTPFPVMDTKWIGGVITSTAAMTGTGFLVADTGSKDSSLIGATVSGWQFGFNIAPGASHVTIADNAVGDYGFLDVPAGGSTTSRTNATGGNVAAGSGDWIDIHDNKFSNNTLPLGFAATGIHSVVHDNPGYNPVGIAAVTLGASPAIFTNGPTTTDLYIYGAAVTTVSINGAGLCIASPCAVSVGPFQTVVTAYPGAAPTVVRSVH